MSSVAQSAQEVPQVNTEPLRNRRLTVSEVVVWNSKRIEKIQKKWDEFRKNPVEKVVQNNVEWKAGVKEQVTASEKRLMQHVSTLNAEVRSLRQQLSALGQKVDEASHVKLEVTE